LIAGIVVTGGGSQLKHITQLIEYVTGMDARLGYPNEHLAKSSEEVTSPMYATGVGLVLRGLEETERHPEAQGAVVTHTKKTKGNWFDQIFSKGKEWFNEDPE
ncbi:MAG TPA: cell division protein FtsA, partial [Bacteroidia bacterium]|nr:cell division protein FtsA [Bacteroidia bacterium]